MEIFVVLAAFVLIWMAWQLYRAKQFNHFKDYLTHEIKPQVFKHIKEELIQSRCSKFPNNQFHIDASCYYWGQFHVRILQAALERDLLTTKQLKETGKYRFCQHLFHIEKEKLHQFLDTASIDKE